MDSAVFRLEVGRSNRPPAHFEAAEPDTRDPRPYFFGSTNPPGGSADRRSLTEVPRPTGPAGRAGHPVPGTFTPGNTQQKER